MNSVNWHSRGCVVSALVIFWLDLAASPSSGATYFVDANHPYARDSNPGVEALPFKTINKATSLVNAGDTVFVKAGVYRETVILSRSGTSTTGTGRTGPITITSPVTIAVYPGHEGKAIIDAAEPVTNWRKCTGPQECAGNPHWEHVYWADVATLVKSHPESNFAVRQVFQHGKLLKRSRYPDTGWSYPTSMPDPMKTFIDSTLTQPSGYFTGAVCHIKTQVWQVNQVPISSFSQSTITLASSPRYAISPQFGYYITSIVGEINAEGEWAYDAAQKRIYLWPRGDMPDGVEFTYRQYCLYAHGGTAWNVVRGLTLRHAYRYGVYLYRSSNMTIEDNTVEHAYDFGLHMYAGTGGKSENNQVLRNTFKYCCYYGISIDAASANTNVEGNYVYATGAASFGDDLMNGRGEGIFISGTHTRVYNNRIDRTGLTGLYVSGKTLGRDISYNYITNTNLTMSDSGGIYTGGFSDVPEKDRIHHNIIADTIGCLAMNRSADRGTPPTVGTHSGVAPGIYVDEQGNHRVIEDNTVIGSRMAGIFFHWAFSNVVQRNTLYGNSVTQVWFSGKNDVRTMLLDDTVVDNALFATSTQQRTFYLGINYDNVRFGQSDRNYFYNPYNESHLFVSYYSNGEGRTVSDDLTLYEWKLLSGYDGASRDFSFLEQVPGLSLAEPRASRIIYNATLDVATVDLEGKKYCDVQGHPVSGKVTLQPFESKILISLGEPSAEPQGQTIDDNDLGNPFVEWR